MGSLKNWVQQNKPNTPQDEWTPWEERLFAATPVEIDQYDIELNFLTILKNIHANKRILKYKKTRNAYNLKKNKD